MGELSSKMWYKFSPKIPEQDEGVFLPEGLALRAHASPLSSYKDVQRPDLEVLLI